MHAIAYTLSIGLTIFLPIFFAILLRRRFRVSWFLFGVGTLTFIGSQVVHIPLNNLLSRLGVLPDMQAVSGWLLVQAAIVLGLSAGICEELVRALGYALLKRNRKVQDGLMLGLGHGGIEAMILVGVMAAGGVGQLFALRGIDLQTLGLSSEQITILSSQLEVFSRSPLVAFAPLFERLLAMLLHVVLSLMVLYAFQSRKPLGVLIAIVYHAAVDAIVVGMASQTSNFFLIYGVLCLVMIPGLVWAISVFRKQVRETVRAHLPVEWGLFWQSFRKEMLQLWRTRIVFVIVSVFAIFGMASPLLAHFIPQIIGSIEGAEMFKDLIPTPSVKDALDQYIKNISQFGFLIAILVGMGQVASEKEKGITEMILHKPLPRWAFILSKFMAQAVIYLAAFAVAELLGYAYTVYLFEPLSLGLFTVMNLLMFVWLLCFVAIATLGSTLTRSIGAAAGVSVVGAVAMMLTAQIPQYGSISPQALMGWAGVIAREQALSLQTSNFSALGMGVVFIILCMVWAMGLFERQEI